MKTRFKSIAAVLSAAVLILSGCGSSNEEAPAAAETTAPVTEAVTTEEKEITTVSEIERIVVTARPDAERKQVALTFDDGPNTTTTAEILDILEQYGIKASFFVIGQNINEDSAKVMKRAYDMGCEINSHSFTHSYMNEMEADAIKEEMDKTAELVREATGEYPKFFRPPYIAVNSTLYDTVDIPFICGEGCNDWNVKIPVVKRVQFLTERTKDGMIILLHDAAGNKNTVDALKEAIPAMLEDGYEFLTVTELFKAKGVTPDADSEVMYTTIHPQK